MAGRVMADKGAAPTTATKPSGGGFGGSFDGSSFNSVPPSPGYGAGGFGGSFGGTPATQPVGKTSFGSTAGLGAPASPVPTAAPSAAPNGGGGGVGVSSTGQVSNIDNSGGAAGNQQMSQADWWNQDPNYQAELAGYAASLAAAQQALSAGRTQYDTDFVQTLKNLGWNSDGINNNNADIAATTGSWNPNDMLGAYGRGYNNLNNDYAGRGLLTSSFYGDALGNFGTDFNNQRANLIAQRQNSVNNQTAQEQQAKNDYVNAQTRAKQSSLGRAGMQGLTLLQ